MPGAGSDGVTSKARAGTPEQSLSVARAVELLMTLTRDGPSRMNELVDTLGLPRRNISRLVSSLEVAGLVRRDARTLQYDLGSTLAWMGRVAAERSDIVTLAEPLLQDLMARTRTTTLLHVRQVDAVVLAHICVPSDRLSVTFPLGGRIPLWKGTGRAVLAHLRGDERDRYLRTEAAGMDEVRLEEIRRQGFEASRGEVVEGVLAVGAPVFDPTGAPIAIVAIAGVTERVLDHAPDVAETAGLLTSRLGGTSRSQPVSASSRTGTGSPSPAHVGREAVSAAEIRQWARERGLDVPARGRIPLRIRSMFDSDASGLAETP